MNKTFILGNIGQDAEVKTNANGKEYLTFTVAVNDGKNDKGEPITTWFNASSWNESLIKGKIKDYLKKGGKVLITGKYVPTIWMRESNGVVIPTISHNIMINEIELCGPTGGSSQAPPPPAPYQKPERPTTTAALMEQNGYAPVPTTDEQDLPF